MKLSPHFPTILLVILFSIAGHKGTSQTQTFSLTEVENPFVVIQLKALNNNQDSVENAEAVKTAVDQIKAINTVLGYDQFDKKIASIILDSNGNRTPYLAIRNFEDFTAAEAYCSDLRKRMKGDIYGVISEPFPISPHNWMLCVANNDFDAYYKFYSSTKK
jgi:hypothetical protein